MNACCCGVPPYCRIWFAIFYSTRNTSSCIRNSIYVSQCSLAEDEFFYGQIEIDRVLFDRLTYPFECLSICFKKIRKCEEL